MAILVNVLSCFIVPSDKSGPYFRCRLWYMYGFAQYLILPIQGGGGREEVFYT